MAPFLFEVKRPGYLFGKGQGEISARIRIGDLDRPAFSHAYGIAHVATGAILLPCVACFMQDTSNGVRTHVGKTIQRTAQCTL